MKKLICFVVLLVLLAALAPWIDGWYFKRQFSHLLALLNQNNQQIRFTIKDYHLGWLHSRAQLQIDKIPTPAFSTTPPHLILDQTIAHGPFLWDSTQKTFTLALAKIYSEFHLPDFLEKNINNNTHGILQITSTVDFAHYYSNQLLIPALNVSLPNQAKFLWQGLHGEINFNAIKNQISAVQADFNFGAFSIVHPYPLPLQLTVQPITLSYDGNLHPLKIWITHLKLFIPDVLLINTINHQTFHIENLNVAINNDITNNALYQMSEQLTLQHFGFPIDDMSPITSAYLNFKLKNLNPTGLLAIANDFKMYHEQATPWPDLTHQWNMLNSLSTKAILPTSIFDGHASFISKLGPFELNAIAMHFSSGNNLINSLKNGDAQLSIKIAIPLFNRLLDLYIQMLSINKPSMNAYLPDIMHRYQTLDETYVEKFNNKIADLMKQGKLTLSAAIQIMALRNQELLTPQFSKALLNMDINTATSSQIISLYTQILTQQHQQEEKQHLSSTDKAQDLLDHWLKQDYLTRDENDYNLILTINHGILQLNQHTID